MYWHAHEPHAWQEGLCYSLWSIKTLTNVFCASTLWLLTTCYWDAYCMFIVTWEAHLQLRISLKTASTVHNVHEVDGGPGEGHAVASKTLAELLWLPAKLLQLLFILSQKYIFTQVSYICDLYWRKTAHKLQYIKVYFHSFTKTWLYTVQHLGEKWVALPGTGM